MTIQDYLQSDSVEMARIGYELLRKESIPMVEKESILKDCGYIHDINYAKPEREHWWYHEDKSQSFGDWNIWLWKYEPI